MAWYMSFKLLSVSSTHVGAMFLLSSVTFVDAYMSDICFVGLFSTHLISTLNYEVIIVTVVTNSW